MPRDFIVELNCAVADRLDEGQQIALANEITRFIALVDPARRAGRALALGEPVPDPARPGRAGVRRRTRRARRRAT